MTEEQFAAGRQAILTRNPMPELTKVREAGQRRRRRHQVAGVAAVAAIVVVGVAALHGAASTTTAQTPAKQGSTLIAQPAAMPAASKICATLPINKRQVYMLLSQDNCRPEKPLVFGRTNDNGSSWSAVNVPREAACPADLQVTATTIAAHTFMLCGLITHDDGASWARVPAAGPGLRQIPAGWPVLVPVFHQTVGLEAIDPSTGQAHPLASAPGDLAPSAPQRAMLPASDGSYWAALSPSSTSKVGAVSRDKGQSWDTLALPPANGTKNVEVSSADGRTGYAVYYRPGSTTELYTTTDGGANWHQVQAQLPSGVTGIQVREDGALLGFNDQLAPNQSPVYVSKTGGRTFTQLTEPLARGTLSRDAIGTYILSDGFSALAMSADGKTFTAIPVPAGAKP
jgi:hypothetical protein